MRRIDGGPSLGEYIDKEENITWDGKERLPPINELGGEDSDGDNDYELELPDNDGEPTQNEVHLENIEDEEPIVQEEPISQEYSSKTKMEMDCQDQEDSVEAGNSEQSHLRRGKRTKLPRIFLTQ